MPIYEHVMLSSLNRRKLLRPIFADISNANAQELIWQILETFLWLYLADSYLKLYLIIVTRLIQTDNNIKSLSAILRNSHHKSQLNMASQLIANPHMTHLTSNKLKRVEWTARSHSKYSTTGSTKPRRVWGLRNNQLSHIEFP